MKIGEIFRLYLNSKFLIFTLNTHRHIIVTLIIFNLSSKFNNKLIHKTSKQN